MWPTIIIARQIATKRVKAELAAQGIKLRQVKALDIKRWADVYLDQHAELLAEAEAIIEVCPELKKIAERQRARDPSASRVPSKPLSLHCRKHLSASSAQHRGSS
jgi:hypothetical protein